MIISAASHSPSASRHSSGPQSVPRRENTLTVWADRGDDAPTENIAEFVEYCSEHGLIDNLRAALESVDHDQPSAPLRAVRDLVYELAGAQNRDLAVDVLIYATGVAEFDQTSLRDYARKHALSPEGFRQHVLKFQRRLGLPQRAAQLG